MMPIQEIEIRTKNGRIFYVHLEKWTQAHFECKLASIHLGPQLPADAVFGPFSKGDAASTAYQTLVSQLREALAKLDATDAIIVVNNPCNTEFVSASEQRRLLGEGVTVQENGVDA